MARLVCSLNGNFDEILKHINDEILKGSISASYEDGYDFNEGSVRCAVRVYERYSYFGKNRVSLNITLLQSSSGIQICAVTSGGSQAMFWKINTVGENNFLDKLEEVILPYR